MLQLEDIVHTDIQYWIYLDASYFVLVSESVTIFLGMYVGDILEGTAQKSGTPEIVKEKPGTALVDAKNVLGPVCSSLLEDFLEIIISVFVLESSCYWE